VTTFARVPTTLGPKRMDWVVDQFTDLFRTTHKVKTLQVVKPRGRHCGDIDLMGYLTNVSGPMPLALDLRIVQSSPTTVSDVVLTLILMDTTIASRCRSISA
jgi:hypothetical protein